MRRALRWGKIGLVVIVVLAAVLTTLVRVTASRWLPEAIAAAPNAGRVVDAPSPVPDGVTQQMRVDVGPPAATLSLWVMDPPAAARGTILVLHGLRDRKSSMLGMGKRLVKEGYRAVLVDLRGHGESSGQWLTYGVVESRDLSQVLDALDRESLLTGSVGVYGASYGGATALMLAGRDARVRAVVSVAAFASMRTEVPYFVRSRAPGWLVSDTAISRAVEEAGRLAGFDPDEASPFAAIQRTTAPVLLIHGDPDEKVPADHGRQLRAVASSRSDLIVVASAGHDAFFRDPDAVIARATTTWFSKWLAQPIQ